MAIDEMRGKTGSFIERVKALFARPKEAWPEIARDMTPSGELFTRYAMPLAAIAPVVGLLAGRVVGWSPFGFSFFGQLFTAAAGYAFSMVNLLVMSFIASKQAPRFGGEGSPRDAFKLIVYSSTAAWIASAVAMVPGLGFVGLASFYSLYLYVTGIGPIMKVPEENKARFAAVTIVCAIALNMFTMVIANAPARMLGGGFPARPAHVSTADGPDFSAIGREINEAMRQGKLKPAAPSDLQALLPASVGDFRRIEVESQNDEPGGSHAQATYEKGDKHFTLRVIDLANLARWTQVGAAFNIEKNREDEDGYERVTSRDGHFIVEKWDRDDTAGEYQTLVDKRFMVKAEGEADSVDQLKSAVASISADKLKLLEK